MTCGFRAIGLRARKPHAGGDSVRGSVVRASPCWEPLELEAATHPTTKVLQRAFGLSDLFVEVGAFKLNLLTAGWAVNRLASSTLLEREGNSMPLRTSQLKLRVWIKAHTQ